jgi:hypothetical protein
VPNNAFLAILDIFFVKLRLPVIKLLRLQWMYLKAFTNSGARMQVNGAAIVPW